jgi:hypothetical protein
MDLVMKNRKTSSTTKSSLMHVAPACLWYGKDCDV